MKAITLLLTLSMLLPAASFAQDQSESKQKTREFLMSCSYGILTGTLVGAASLAFTESPGDNLHRVARGASLGLYAGIALGYFVVNLDESSDPELTYPDGDLPTEVQRNSWHLLPILNEKGIDGLEFRVLLNRF